MPVRVGNKRITPRWKPLLRLMYSNGGSQLRSILFNPFRWLVRLVRPLALKLLLDGEERAPPPLL